MSICYPWFPSYTQSRMAFCSPMFVQHYKHKKLKKREMLAYGYKYPTNLQSGENCFFFSTTIPSFSSILFTLVILSTVSIAELCTYTCYVKFVIRFKIK